MGFLFVCLGLMLFFFVCLFIGMFVYFIVLLVFIQILTRCTHRSVCFEIRLKSTGRAGLYTGVFSETVNPESKTICESGWMWRTKNSSPSTEPRGTPHTVIWGADVTSLTVNAMNFLVKEERKHWKKRKRNQRPKGGANAR